MSIVIHNHKCVGCKKCLAVCPGSLIKPGVDGKVYMKYPEECWGCSSCLKECKYGAISFYLGADIGGMGSNLIVTTEGDVVHWQIEKLNGEKHVIDVNRKVSNQY